ncbi:MAG TPA: metal-sensing transcriptional repressor [Chitinophagaceae bacterium]|nr:metal-sensing transcriptional repressor [Chitinophagaceae bacterium]
MIPQNLTKDITTRLATVRGQVDGLIKMLHNNKDPEKIIEQFKAVNSGLKTTYKLLLNETCRKALALKIVEVTNVCPGNCGYEKKIDMIRQEFPNFKSEEIIIQLKEISKIGERVTTFNKKNI